MGSEPKIKSTITHMTHWKQILTNLKHEYLKATAPGFYQASGGATYKIKPYSDTKANGLARCVIDWITFHGGTANRINTTGMMRKINGRMQYTYSNTRKGTADIHAIYQGKHLSIEIKIGRDKMSDHQFKEKERIEKAGGLYFVAKDMNSFTDWWNTIQPAQVQDVSNP
jgi:hypothetical protein